MLRTLKSVILAGVAATPLLLGVAMAQQTPPASEDIVIVTGTRVENRSALDTAVAVDVVSADVLESGGVTEVNQALSIALPSFNFPRPALNDGTDTIRPATLRGLSPDQTLVLVNSKRRHAASLVNVNGSIGRGSSSVDMNTIPTSAISAVEVLRDGASAQYGSDAIAGVINVRLREENSGGNITASYGQRETSYDVPTNPFPASLGLAAAPATLSRDRSDGRTQTVGGWVGLPLFTEQGFVTVSAEYKHQDHTERSGYDTRQQYAFVGGNPDPREANANRWNAWTGEPDMDQYTILANAGYDIGQGAELYGWASYQNREAVSAGFFRRPLDDRNISSIYPDGFLPKINPTVTDYSGAFGTRFTLADWDLDTSLVYGKNKMEFDIVNTLNRSIGPTSSKVFDAGGFEYEQAVFNFSGVKQYEIGAATPLNVAAGVEWRRERYGIFAGEPDSYRNGGVLLPINTGGCTLGALGTTGYAAAQVAGGCATPSGAQVFPGFRPSNEVGADRDAVGVYIDLEANLTDALLVSAAARAESYSDFGDTATGKLSARYDFNDMFALRGSVQNGFRAPSLQQQFFATTSTNFIDGVPFEITTFPVSDPVAIALGAQPLKAEESINYSVGAVIRVGDLNITIDGYRIDIDDRIVLSENLTQANVRTFLQNQGFVGVGGGRFFINGVDTETQGVDIVANYSLPEMSYGKFGFTFGANFTNTDVTRVPALPVLSALTPPPELFSRANVLAFEEGQPKDKYTFGVNWEMGAFSAGARAIRYGEVLAPGTSAAQDFQMSPKTVLDLDASWQATDMVKLTVGADNVLDQYPDALRPSLNTTNNTPFTSIAPFGYSGRFVYARVGVDF
ncbi:MAG: TonB-dependent receptor [Hyphomonadaceae bacterium]|nr:TonB-dependent receptor [Hyphomonadaceae bacterium]